MSIFRSYDVKHPRTSDGQTPVITSHLRIVQERTVAKPDLDDGWIPMSHELFCALNIADFTKAQGIVVDRMLSQQFGPAKAAYAVVIPKEVALEMGCIRQTIEKGIDQLLTAGIIGEIEEISRAYRFLKNYAAWLDNKGKVCRFTDLELRYIALAPSRAVAFRKFKIGTLTTVKNSTQLGAKSAPNEVQVAPNQVQELHPTGCESAPNEVPNCTQLGAAQYIGTHAELRIGELDTTTPAAVENSQTQKPKSKPAVPSTLSELYAWCAVAVPEIEDITGKLAGWAASYPIEWIHDAIQTALAKADRGKLASYAFACLKRWNESGGPEHRKKKVEPASEIIRASPERRAMAAKEKAEREANKNNGSTKS